MKKKVLKLVNDRILDECKYDITTRHKKLEYSDWNNQLLVRNSSHTVTLSVNRVLNEV